MKTCTWCKVSKPLSEFHKDKRISDGHKGSCRLCENAKIALWRDSQRAAFNARARQAYQTNGDTQRRSTAAWKAVNAERVREYNLSYEEQNKGKRTAINARRRALKRQATPVWADQVVIEQLYIQCAEITRVTGIAHEVDHIVPLDHHLVCGLHVEHNLQILTASENASKKNTFIPI